MIVLKTNLIIFLVSLKMFYFKDITDLNLMKSTNLYPKSELNNEGANFDSDAKLKQNLCHMILTNHLRKLINQLRYF